MPAYAAESSDPPRTSLWMDVIHGLQGKQRDYTTEPPRRALVLLAIPMALEMVMESLFALVDVYWVSHLGSDAVAIVGLTEAVMTLIYSASAGIAFAATAMVARCVGAKDHEGAARAAAQVLVLGLTVATALGVVLGCAAPNILAALGASPVAVELGTDFAQIMLGGNVTVFMIFLINAIFRGAGDAALAMRTLWLANALNILLGPCFIFGWGPFPELGVTGAAIATNLGRAAGVAYQLWHLIGRRGRLQLQLHHFRPARAVLATLAVTSSSGVAQTLIGTASWLGLFKILATFGGPAVAGFTIAMRLVAFGLMPAWGVASAAATLVGQNLGAAQGQRAEIAVRMAARFNVVLLALIGAAFAALADPLTRLFTVDHDVHVQATQALRIVCSGFPAYALGMCFATAFNGAGDTWTPTRVNFCCFWLGQIPLAWTLAVALGLGAAGVFIAVPASFAALALWSKVLFDRGSWKTHHL